MAKPTQGEPAEQLYRDIGLRVREARAKAKVSQQALAERVDLTRTSITNIEKGNQRFMVHTLFAIASELRVGVSDLIPDHGSAGHGTTNFDLIQESALRNWVMHTVGGARPKR